jgi:hypothetical protein
MWAVKGIYHIDYQRFCPVVLIGSPQPLPRKRVFTPLGPRWGEETLACRGGGRRLDRNFVTLHISYIYNPCTMWALLSVACQSDRLKTGNHRVKWSCKIATKHKARRMHALPYFCSLESSTRNVTGFSKHNILKCNVTTAASYCILLPTSSDKITKNCTII